MEENYLVFVLENESKQQIAECDNLGDCERVIIEYCDERDMLRLTGKESYELRHMEHTFQTQNREVNFLVENTNSLKKKIEDFLNDCLEIRELDCDNTINYLQNAVELLQNVLNEMGNKKNCPYFNDNKNIPTGMEYLTYVLEDDNTEFGGISYSGQTLNDFLSEVGMSPDVPMNEINESLIECGIKPIEY